jgi:hypothetical protein
MTKTITKISLSLLALHLLAACTTVPTGPSVLVMPGSGKNFDQFRFDDAECRQFASEQSGGTTASSAAVDSGVRSAAVGTLLGAAAGAAINGRSGAGVGAGAGLLYGGLAGTGAADASARGMQRRYDYGYQQCMYAKGNRIPVSGRVATAQRRNQYLPPSYMPPPPPPPGASAPPPPPVSPQ